MCKKYSVLVVSLINNQEIVNTGLNQRILKFSVSSEIHARKGGHLDHRFIVTSVSPPLNMSNWLYCF